jgi:thioredoxin reductase
MSARRVAVIGAGPIGLEAALGALARGFEVTVFEKGRVGDNLRRWGSTRFFSPLAMNLSPRARAALGARDLPGHALLSGPEMVERVLEPLAGTPALRDRVRLGCHVRAVGRGRYLRRDLPGHPLRAEKPFRLLVDSARGEEVVEADFVLDASGTYEQPAALGAGGIPAPGERRCNGRLVRHLGTLDERLSGLSADSRVLLVGHGHSAANALLALAALQAPPRVTWATRSANRRPCQEVANDPLPERDRVTAGANGLAAAPPSFLTVERRATVDRLQEANGHLDVALSGGRGGRYDLVIGMTGYRPDLSFLSELALDVSPFTEGAARLARRLAGAADCLAVPALAAADLGSGEPGFHMVGVKSYGRLPTFLLKTGLGQLETILDGLTAAG